jgi:hypothetical protein
MRKLFALFALAAAATVAAASGAYADNSPVVISFVKSPVAAGHYAGTTADNCSLDVYMADSYVTGGVQHFTATFVISNCGTRDLTAVLPGIFNFSTGRTVLNGSVTSGWVAGAQAHEEGQIDWNTGAFAGTLQLMPASS